MTHLLNTELGTICLIALTALIGLVIAYWPKRNTRRPLAHLLEERK